MRIDNVRVTGPIFSEYKRILTPEALRFAARLAINFQKRRDELLDKRQIRWAEIKAGKMPDFLQTQKALDIRNSDWKVAPIRPDLECCFAQITGPSDDTKMVINALNSGADQYMTDFEDSLSPTWANIISGQLNIRGAVDRTLTYETPKKKYKLNDKTATLMVRPRGWQMNEKHVLVDGQPISASLFDFGLFLYHNANKLIKQGKTPAFYLPKMESHEEAELWGDVFNFSEEELGIPHGTLRATVLIETILAAFEMDEILHGLKDYSAGLNAGRWDYLFSFIKKFSNDPRFVLPDRSQVTMDQHFLKSYVDLLVQTCHKRGIHGVGGMSALIPRSDDPTANALAIANVVKDKEIEVKQGCDGAWVAHPGLVRPVREVFEKNITGPHQIHVQKRQDVKVTASDLLTVPKGDITEGGLRTNIRVSLEYLVPWLKGKGCVPVDYKMEDLATVEISRSQVWQWLEHKATLKDGRKVTWPFVEEMFKDELNKFIEKEGGVKADHKTINEAANIFKKVVASREYAEFLSLVAYDGITTIEEEPNKETKEEFIKRVEDDWKNNPRWEGVVRPYSAEDVYKLKGTADREFTIAKNGARKLWNLLHEDEPLRVLSAVTGNQAIEEVQAGLRGVYVSGWQVAADMNNSLQMYPDQSLYTSDSVPTLVKRINNSLMRADQITHLEEDHKIDWMVPLVADAEAGFGDKLHSFEIMKQMIEAGASGVHFEDQLASVKKCGHLGGKVIVSTKEFIDKLVAARLACDVSGVDTLIIARTDAGSGSLLTSDIDDNDKPFIIYDESGKPKRTSEGFYMVKAGLEQAISRGRAYAPYADLLWMETSTPDLEEARKFAEGIHAKFPEKLLAYNCSPSFSWRANFMSKVLNKSGLKLTAKEITQMGYAKVRELVNEKLPDIGYAKIEEQVNQEIENFQRELGKMGYKFQFVTLSGFHSLNHGMFELARAYKEKGMLAYSYLQDVEFDSEKYGYTATKHQRFVGTGYFDAVTLASSGGKSSTTAMKGSTEEAQFTSGKK